MKLWETTYRQGNSYAMVSGGLSTGARLVGRVRVDLLTLRASFWTTFGQALEVERALWYNLLHRHFECGTLLIYFLTVVIFEARRHIFPRHYSPISHTKYGVISQGRLEKRDVGHEGGGKPAIVFRQPSNQISPPSPIPAHFFLLTFVYAPGRYVSTIPLRLSHDCFQTDTFLTATVFSSAKGNIGKQLSPVVRISTSLRL